MTRHKWMNTFFRGVESSSKQVFKNCGLIKDNCFIPSHYIREGIVQYQAGECTTKAIEQMVAESLLNTNQNVNNYQPPLPNQ